MAKNKKVSRINPPSPNEPNPVSKALRKAAGVVLPGNVQKGLKPGTVQKGLNPNFPATPSVIPPQKKQPKPGRFK
jgi:hypothetical protein